MKSRYTYICKLATQLSKTNNIRLNNITEQITQYNRTDIMYLVLAILMNNGLLFPNKFSNYDWYLDKNEFSPFCAWCSDDVQEDINFISLPDEEIYDQDYAEFIRVLREEYNDEQQKRQTKNIDYLREYSEFNEKQKLEYLDYLEEIYDLDTQSNLCESLSCDEWYTNSKTTPNPYVDKVTYQLKDNEGNISGKKIMWLLRNKCAHNEYEVSDYHILLQLNNGKLEMIDYDLFVILNTYLEELINVNPIKHLLNQRRYYTQEEIKIDESYAFNENDVIKINEIISMFNLLLKEFYNSHQIEDAKNADEIILNFNSYLNDISNFDNRVIEAIDNPDYEIAQLSVLFFMIFVLSNWDVIDVSSINLNFINIYSNKSKIDNLNDTIKIYEDKIKKLVELSNSNERIQQQVNVLKEKILFVQKNIEYINSNENIIKHIRNSFAHGYYYFKEDKIYIFDYDSKQKQTYYASCNIVELLNFVLSDDVLGTLYCLKETKFNLTKTK